jgi:hypothetical protein
MAGSRTTPRRGGIKQSSRRVVTGVLVVMQLGQGAVFAQHAPTRGDEREALVSVPRDPFAVDFGARALSDRADAAAALRRPAVFRDALARATQPSTSSRGNWASRHPILLGTAIGASGALVWQAASCKGSSCKPGTAALVGAGAGAYGGLIASAIGKAAKKEPVSRGTKIGIAAGAIGAVVGVLLACYGAGGCGGVS